MTPLLVGRVFTWNERRYDRDYNQALFLSLLTEEWQEWMEASADVDLLDALIDIQFVALGGVWKLNVVDEVDMQLAQEAAYVIVDKIIELDDFQPAYAIMNYIASIQNGTISPLVGAIVIQLLAECQVKLMGLTHAQAERAFEVVCDSNDSKTIKKTASDVKANVDKGNFFIAPEPRLQGILDERLV